MNTEDLNKLNERIKKERSIINDNASFDIEAEHYRELVLFKLIEEIAKEKKDRNEDRLTQYLNKFKELKGHKNEISFNEISKELPEVKDLLVRLYRGGNQAVSYYHYTDLNGVLGIFNDYIICGRDTNIAVSSCCMRASDIRYLNDSEEYLEGKCKLEAFIEKGKTKFLGWEKLLNNNGELKHDKPEPLYSISFCGDGNLLSQWKYYGKNSGVAIKFNFKNVYCFIGNLKVFEDLEKIKEGEYDNFSFYKVDPIPIGYTEIEKNRLFVGSCFRGEGYESEFFAPSEDIIPYCKNELFAEEKESRLIFRLEGNILNIVKQPVWGYSVSDGKIKPFIPVQFFNKNGENIIESLTVGPGTNQHLIFNALIHIFDGDNKFINDENVDFYPCKNGVSIKKSKIPFRG